MTGCLPSRKEARAVQLKKRDDTQLKILDLHFKEEFSSLMSNLPVPVSEEDIQEMFSFADKDGDGELSYEDFLTMIKPQQPPPQIRPSIKDF